MPEDSVNTEEQENQRLFFLRDLAIQYLKKWIGHFYLWGGDDPSGFDCSGLIMEVMKGVGHLGHKVDFTAKQLYQLYQKTECDSGHKGCLVFWKNNVGEVIHVEMMIDEFHTIGASGGGSKTLTIADAIKHNAFVKMRPVIYRGSNYVICDPFEIKKNE